MRAYELHAPVKQIQRSKGRSSVAAAAYRSASRLTDERTGLVHDYTKKQGVEHSRIYLPDNAPVWARDRSSLWNAVEVKENRSNSCTARELELAFPAEFHTMQRREAGDKICHELMRRYGCAVDISYHQPDKNGDERNHHAHILFTTRGFDASSKDGWEKKKYRDLNNDKITIDGEKVTRGKTEIRSLREFTANELNKISERDQLQVKTEHLSFEARGIDQEPTQHRGNTATQMERNNKVSYIEEENRQRQTRNSQRAMLQAEAAQQAAIMLQKTLSEKFAVEKAKNTAERHQTEQGQMTKHHGIERERLEKSFKEDKAFQAMKTEYGAVKERLQAKGVKKVARDLFQRTAQDKEKANALKMSLKLAKSEQDKQRLELENKQQKERGSSQTKQTKERHAEEKKQTATAQGRAGKEAISFQKKHVSFQQPSNENQQENKKSRGKPSSVPPPPREALKVAQRWKERKTDQGQQKPQQATAKEQTKTISERWQAKKEQAQRQADSKQTASQEQKPAIAVQWAERKKQDQPEPTPPKPTRKPQSPTR